MTSPAAGLKKAGGLATMLGILLVVFGILAVGAPLMTGVWVTYIVGFLVLAAGITHTVFAFQSEDWRRGVLTFLLGVAGVLAGLLVIAHPLYGLGLLTLVLAAWFLIDGIFGIILAFQLKPEQGWGWTLFTGILGVLLGILIWRQWPLSGAWAVGVLAGTNIIFMGWSLIAGGSVARGVARAVE
jgi:uncharacterized membrane protein HdeD (DUF308 family)